MVLTLVQPVISVNKSDENDEVHVIVYSPQRIMHHPSGLKFELRFYKFIIEKDDDHTIDFGMADAEFNEDPTSHVFTLPPQACKTSGGLKVGAVYGDGTVEFCGPIKVELPCYGMCITYTRPSDLVLWLPHLQTCFCCVISSTVESLHDHCVVVPGFNSVCVMGNVVH